MKSLSAVCLAVYTIISASILAVIIAAIGIPWYALDRIFSLVLKLAERSVRFGVDWANQL